MRARPLVVVMVLLVMFVFSAPAVAGTAYVEPKLVLQITVDQMRGDFPMRYEDRLAGTPEMLAVPGPAEPGGRWLRPSNSREGP